jgi:hypothetical protein
MDKSLIPANLSNLSESDLDSLLEQVDILSTFTLLDYAPHPKQVLFHEAPAKIRFLSGGNRSGKTEAGTWEDVAHATGLYPDWFPQSNRLLGANRGRVIVTDYAKGGSTYEEKLWKYLPRNLVVSIKRTNKGALEKVEVRHKMGGVSIIEIMTHEQDDMAFEGWSGHWAHFDEPPPREKFIATLRGLIDFRGRCWLTLTPINQPWLYDEFISKSDADKNVFYLVVDMMDNPHTPLEEKEIFIRSLTEEEKEARVHGRFKHLTGLVYKQFDPSVHIISKDKIKIEPSWPKFFVCDPHDRKPHFGIWATVDPFGTVYIIGEIRFQGTIQEFAKQVFLKEVMNKDWRIKPMEVIRIGDPNKMNTPSAVNGLKMKEEFAKHALYFITDVNNDITLGHLAVADKLSYNKHAPLSTTNKPKMFFLKEYTPTVIQYLQLYTWDDWKGSGRDTKSAKEKPQEKYKDFPDCLRYLIMYNPVWYQEEADPEPRNEGSTTGY